MAPVHGKDARVYVNGYDLSLFLKSAGVSGEAEPGDVTTFGVGAKKYIPGIMDGKLKAEGIYDGDPLAADKQLRQALNNPDTVWSILVEGDGFGKGAFAALATATQYEVETDVGDVAQTTVEAQSNVGLEAVNILHVLQQEVATGNGANLDNGALTSNGLHAYLHVTDVAGAAPSLVVKLQHSVDNSVWVDLLTFTAVTLDNKAQRMEVAKGTTINRHLRAQHTLSGTITGATYSLVAGRK